MMNIPELINEFFKLEPNENKDDTSLIYTYKNFKIAVVDNTTIKPRYYLFMDDNMIFGKLTEIFELHFQTEIRDRKINNLLNI